MPPALEELRRVAAELTHHAPHEEGELPTLEQIGDALAGPGGRSRPEAGSQAELNHLRAENAQLRALCGELEQALHESSQQGEGAWAERSREYEALLEERSQRIRGLHEQVEQLQAALEEAKAEAPKRPAGVPATREEELLTLSEELERERRQLQEDEQALMEQMRQMEVSMARERADMARQRNDLQRLQGDIFHELERLERSGALQTKIESLKTRLQDATNRRGTSPGTAAGGSSGSHQPVNAPQPPPAAPSKKEGLIGRLFGKGG